MADSESPAPTPLTPKPLPPVQRLSRAVLVAIAGLVTVTLLAVTFLATPRPLAHPSPVSRPPAAGEPGFLQRPPAAPPPGRPGLSEEEYIRQILARGPQPGAGGRSAWSGAGGSGGLDPLGSGEAGKGGNAAGEGGNAWNAAGEAGSMGSGSGDGGEASGDGARRGAAALPTPRDLRREAFLRALRAPLALPAAPAPPRSAGLWPPPWSPEAAGVDGSDGSAAAEEPSRGWAWADASQASQPARGRGAGGGAAPYGGLAVTAPGRSAAVPPPAAPVSPRTTLGAPASGAGAGGADGGGNAADGRRGGEVGGGGRPAVLPAGTVVSALLLTAVNSDLPGPLMAQVSRDVYDLHQRAVVLPRGTRLLGSYENRVAVGQRRLLVAWTRLQLLDGTLLELPGLPGNDAAGAAGVPARVQNHLLRVFGDAVLLSLLSAGAELAVPPPRSLVSAPSAGSVASAAAGQQLSDVGLQLLRRDLAIQPTLRLAAGTPLTVFVNADLPLGTPGPGAWTAATRSAGAAPDGERR